MEKIEIKNIRMEIVQKAMEKLIAAVENFEAIDNSAGGWLDSCGSCTGCRGKGNFSAWHKKISENFAFAKNSCFSQTFCVWLRGSSPSGILYQETDGSWRKSNSGDKLSWREILEKINLAYEQAKIYAAKISAENEKAEKNIMSSDEKIDAAEKERMEKLDAAEKEYDEKLAAPREERDEKIAAALKECDEKTAAARKERDEKIDAAVAAYEEKIDAPWKERNEKIAAAWKEYEGIHT